MVRTYRRKVGGRPYNTFNEEDMERAVRDVKEKRLSYRQASDRYNIKVATLHIHVKCPNLLKPGGQTALSEQEETYFVECVQIMSNWGFPLQKKDLCLLVKTFLDKKIKEG
ncbi:CENP-B N-terminal DNA-binding domain [Popillia japonica]|uniref:CENP-B N-terminal DNA-binding domain n=1 Tax=Popillia japonica TaxID=7064 RepID=A0AAW1LI90_POPJA